MWGFDGSDKVVVVWIMMQCGILNSDWRSEEPAANIYCYKCWSKSGNVGIAWIFWPFLCVTISRLPIRECWLSEVPYKERSHMTRARVTFVLKATESINVYM
jgi:hypothetical protein